MIWSSRIFNTTAVQRFVNWAPSVFQTKDTIQQYSDAKRHLANTEKDAEELENRAQETATELVKASQQLRYWGGPGKHAVVTSLECRRLNIRRRHFYKDVLGTRPLVLQTGHVTLRSLVGSNNIEYVIVKVQCFPCIRKHFIPWL